MELRHVFRLCDNPRIFTKKSEIELHYDVKKNVWTAYGNKYFSDMEIMNCKVDSIQGYGARDIKIIIRLNW